MSAPLNICLVSGSEEYESDISLARFKDYLEANYNTRCTLLKAIGFEELPGVEALDGCDVALFFTRRLTITGEPLERVKSYLTSGRPIVALRTASHGFQEFLECDKLVYGGNYAGHLGAGCDQVVEPVPEVAEHPVLESVGPFASHYSLYLTAPIADDATLLMTTSTPDSDGPQPATWTRLHNGGRVVYSSLGGLDDFETPAFLQVLVNALFWTAHRTVEAKA